MGIAQDLRPWIEQVRELGLLREVKGADWNLEIGVITELNAKKRRYTLLFDDVKGCPNGFRLLTGALIDAKRVALTYGFPTNITDLELVKAFKEKLSSVGRAINDYPPQYISNAPCLENVKKGEEVNILQFPAPKWHEHDGGRYIGTADCVITNDPDSDWVNVGTYRLMVHNKKELGVLMDTGHHGRLHMNKYFEKDMPCPIAISLGHHPLIFAVAGLEVPYGISEYNYAGALIGAPWKVVKGPITGLPIPADSEVAIEGYLVNELKDEGPFGEFMGYYAGGVFKNPVIKVEAVYYRDEPIVMGTSPGRPPYDYSYYRCPIRAAMIWDILEKAGIPNIKGVWCHEEGYSRAFTVVSLKQAYAGHARQAGFVASQCRPGAYAGRYTVVVDDDIDPTNIHDVIWALCSRTDPATTIEIIRDAWGSPLDPMIEKTPDMKLEECTSSRAIISACRPFSRLIKNTFPNVAESSRETTEKFRAKWKGVLEL